MKFTTTLMLSSIVLEAAASNFQAVNLAELSSKSKSASNLRQRNLKKKKPKDDDGDGVTGSEATQAPPGVITTEPTQAGRAATTAANVQGTSTAVPEDTAEDDSSEMKGKADKEPDPKDKNKEPIKYEFDPSKGGKAQKDELDELEEEAFVCHECDLGGVHICSGSCHYLSGEDVTVSFRTADLDSYANVNATNLSDWKVGIYMKMGHPQRGALSPIVSLKPSITSAADDEDLEGSATFGSSTLASFEGSDPHWPFDLDVWGTGYDVWLLDENGAEILGPYPFTVKPTEAMLEEQAKMEEEAKSKEKHGIAAFSKADKKINDYDADGKSKAGKEDIGVDVDSKAGKGPEGVGLGSGKEGGMILGTYASLEDGSYYLDTDKYAYSPTDSVSVSFDLGDVSSIIEANANQDADGDGQSEGTDITRWTLGIYMRMAHPQDGALDPLVSLPLCGLSTCVGMDPTTLTSGTVTFSSVNVDDLDGSFADWPLDLGAYGTGYDVWLLDGEGVGLAGPIMFTIPILDDVEVA